VVDGKLVAHGMIRILGHGCGYAYVKYRSTLVGKVTVSTSGVGLGNRQFIRQLPSGGTHPFWAKIPRDIL
jgi:hypothetical protein